MIMINKLLIIFLWSVLLFISIALLLIAALGQIDIGTSYYNYPVREWEAFDPVLVERTPSLESLYDVALEQIDSSADMLSPKDVMRILYDTVKKRFTHGDKAKHTLFSNWLLYLLGKIHPAFAHLLDPDLMLRYGHSVLCDQSSYVLLHLALKADIPARHVGLGNHVVMEAWYENDWHMYDPDMEVIPVDKYGNIMGVNALARDETLNREVYNKEGGDKEYIEEIAATLPDRKNHTFVSYPPGAWFVWKAEVLYKFHIMAEYLKFIIPLMFLVISTVWLRYNQKNKGGG
ncbi:membrane protein [Candidatus Thiomargarita nelsonii]|uniref:Membrane protein n=1 Tax=Candidatus Thiomargarita nelsonii TaxID=1003181 RepID=A0A176RVL1_9GAMM|nr:membrane protein [Candidatus Thiomargarita nelsonii]